LVIFVSCVEAGIRDVGLLGPLRTGVTRTQPDVLVSRMLALYPSFEYNPALM